MSDTPTRRSTRRHIRETMSLTFISPPEPTTHARGRVCDRCVTGDHSCTRVGCYCDDPSHDQRGHGVAATLPHADVTTRETGASFGYTDGLKTKKRGR